jgi:hypothetical protein
MISVHKKTPGEIESLKCPTLHSVSIYYTTDICIKI